MLTCTVPSGDACRPRLPGDRLAGGVRPPLEQLGHAGLWAEAARARADLLPSGSRLHLHELGRLDGKRGGVRRSDHRLARCRDTLRQHLPPARVELGEDVVEQEQERRRRQQLGLREEEREHGQALLALRAELAQVAVAARDENIVEVRAESGRAALDVPGQPCFERAGVGGSAS